MVSRKWTLIFIGLGLLSISQIILVPVFYPVVLQEVRYFLQTHNLAPRPAAAGEPDSNIGSEEFRIVIPKIDVNSPVLPDVNPYNKEEYLNALSRGVAQAKGSSLPDGDGNIFIFAHSTDSPLNITRYNAIFYLLNKLNPGDEIFLIFNGKKYKYIVENTEIADPSEIKYLKPGKEEQALTLMTCWPPGTALRRLLVQSYPAK